MRRIWKKLPSPTVSRNKERKKISVITMKILNKLRMS